MPYGDLNLNVEDQSADDSSLLSLYRRLIWFRRSSKALTHGDYAPVDPVPEGVFAYTRTHADERGEERLLVALNFTNGAITFDLPEGLTPKETVATTHADPPASRTLALAPNEGRLLRL